MSQPAATTYVLPSALITRADLARLVREVEALENELESQRARSHATGHEGYHMPNVSQGLSDFADQNKIDLADDHTRMRLKEQLKIMKDKAPVIHMTFAVEADQEALRHLVEYIRKELHPQALLHVGLQPALVGGVYMRTPNQVHDFSLRARLAQSRTVIQQDIDQLLQAVLVTNASGRPVSTTVAQVPVAVEAPTAGGSAPATRVPIVVQSATPGGHQ